VLYRRRRVIPFALLVTGCSTLLALPDSIEFGREPRDGSLAEEDNVSETSGPPVAPPTGPRCEGLAKNCGFNRGCCEHATVEGGMFDRAYDGVNDGNSAPAGLTATVSSFELDVFEVTVGRFRAFLADYHLPDPEEAGSDVDWSAVLPADAASLAAELTRCVPAPTWTGAPEYNEYMPITCINWYEARAFCAWDGGRLPTDAEWNYAAAGGNQQRPYPWSTPDASLTIDTTYAIYSAPGGDYFRGPTNVGSRGLKGQGRWGQEDLAGNVAEWVLDAFGPYPMPCSDCVNHDGPDRTIRNGAFISPEAQLRTAYRSNLSPTTRSYAVGVRCARSP
jgi:formylglycine-generating enzyme required for sulfatase activity